MPGVCACAARFGNSGTSAQILARIRPQLHGASMFRPIIASFALAALAAQPALKRSCLCYERRRERKQLSRFMVMIGTVLGRRLRRGGWEVSPNFGDEGIRRRDFDDLDSVGELYTEDTFGNWL
jgi:hypothetical protein